MKSLWTESKRLLEIKWYLLGIIKSYSMFIRYYVQNQEILESLGKIEHLKLCPTHIFTNQTLLFLHNVKPHKGLRSIGTCLRQMLNDLPTLYPTVFISFPVSSKFFQLETREFQVFRNQTKCFLNCALNFKVTLRHQKHI